MKCVDDQGKEVAIGEPGEIIARGPQIMPGYWRQPGETKNVLRDGWLYTGDIGKMDAEGYFSIVDRRKDMILVSGFNVYPNEVEAVLAGLAGVKECAVIGVPDAASGEAVKAFIVRGDPALDAGTVRDFCRGELASYKVPRLVEFRDDLPKSNVGKILRKELRQNPPPNTREGRCRDHSPGSQIPPDTRLAGESPSPKSEFTRDRKSELDFNALVRGPAGVKPRIDRPKT